MDEKEKKVFDELWQQAKEKKDFDMLKKLAFLRGKLALLRDAVRVSGKWTIKCFEAGLFKWVDSGHNLVVTTGLSHIADQLSDQGEGAMSHMAAGSDNTAPAAGQTALLSQLGSRVALDSTTQTGGNTVVYVCTFGPGAATGTWEEVGIFNASTSGIMLDRLLTGTKVKAAAETFEVTITLTISAA